MHILKETLDGFGNTSGYDIIAHDLTGILSIEIDDNFFEISRVSDSKTEGIKLGLNITKGVPILFLKGNGQGKKGGYHPELKIIIIYENATEETLKHEIIHSIEYDQEKSQDLCSLYQKAKETIDEDSFSGSGFVTFNFVKDIHEFIADGYSKDPFIFAMKKENLYNQFILTSKYLFE